MSSKKQCMHYRLNVEDIMERYNWSDIATGAEKRPGSGAGGNNPGNRNSVATQIRQWDMRNNALKEFLILSLPVEWQGKFASVTGGGYELWQAILSECKKAEVKDSTEVLALFYNLSQGNEEPLNEYVARLQAMVQELHESDHEVSESTKVMCFFNGLNATDKPEDVDILLEQQLTLEQAVSLVVDFAVFRPKATPTVVATVQSSTTPLLNILQTTTTQKEKYDEKNGSDYHGTIAAPPQSKAGGAEAKSVANNTNHSYSNAKATSHSSHTPSDTYTTSTTNTTTHNNTTTSNNNTNTINKPSTLPKTAFELTTLHHGLKNATGEHNCFLNVTIQALWHLGPFRTHLTTFIKEHKQHKQHNKHNEGLLEALCNLFVEYEFTQQSILPATELRNSLASLSDDFKLGEIADANEALDVILQRIHTEQCHVCPQQHKCLSHAVFGGCIMEQSTCMKCNATSEPQLRSDFILCFQAAELLLEAKALFVKYTQDNISDERTHHFKHMSHLHVPNLSRFLGCARRKPTPLHTQEIQSSPATLTNKNTIDASSHHYANTEFGHILSKCMQLNQRTCPSVGASFPSQNGEKNDDKNSNNKNKGDPMVTVAVPYECNGRAKVHQYSLDPPLAVALSIGWMQERETAATLQDFYDIIAPLIKLSDLFSVQATDTTNTNGKKTTGKNSSGNTNAKTNSSGNSTNSGGVSSGNESKSGSFGHNTEQEFLYTSPPVSATNPAYVFRGLVCYYGAHYVSIFQGEGGSFLLFDDYTVKHIGDWDAVKVKCVKSMYQPVLLLYELEKR